MKHAMWGYLIVALGLVIIAILMLVNNLTTADEEDFYVAREVMQSSMSEATDYGTYLTSGEVVMSREKFVEIFLRRFAESVTPNKNYQIDFYQIYEYPPAATVRIRTTTGTTNIKNNAINVDVDTVLSAILVVGKDTSKFNIIDAREVMGLYNVSLREKSYKESERGCKKNCTANLTTTNYGHNFIEITNKSEEDITLDKVTVIYKDGTSEKLNIRLIRWENETSAGLKTKQTHIAYLENKDVMENKNLIETIRIDFKRVSNDNLKNGLFEVDFKYNPNEVTKITTIGGYKKE